jgi:hypothetical protein
MIRLSNDFSRGRGLQYLDTHLAHMRTPRAYDEALRWCVGLTDNSRQQLVWAETCGRRLLERVQTQPGDADNDFRRQLAILVSLELAAKAARLGEISLAEEMLSAALDMSNETEDLPLAAPERRHLLEVVLFQLERSGRL